MFWGNSAKIDILKEMIGTPEEYKKTIELSHLTGEEKDIIMAAYVQLKKKHHNNETMDKAYDILFGSTIPKDSSTTNDKPSDEANKKDTNVSTETKKDEPKEYNAVVENLDDDIYSFKDD